MKYLWWKNEIILENVNGYIHVVDVTILARNVWRGMYNETRPNYEYFMM